MLLGKHITKPGEVLQEVAIERVYKATLNPDGQTAVLVNRLRAIRAIDIKNYNKLKTRLPYLVCGLFHPKIRKKENFLYTERFIVDIDHISEFELDIEELKTKFKQDPRVELYYTSPSGDGLKLFFRLTEQISDSGYYSLFYKAFSVEFARQYSLGAAVDLKTNDVSRCCFVSHDPDAYFNSDIERVDPNKFLPKDEASSLDALHKNLKEIERTFEKEKKDLDIIPSGPEVLTDDILVKIKEKMGMKIRQAKEKYYFQPEELDEIIPQILAQLESVGIKLLNMQPISYGRQLKIGAATRWAEINVFYGQKGMSIVASSKSGSNRELSEHVVEFLKSSLHY